MPTKILTRALIVLSLCGCIAVCSCGNAKTGSSDGSVATPTTPAPTPKTGFEADLDYVRKGQYTYIWVIARKDGKPIDKDDAAFLRKTAPQVVDWVSTEQGKRVIAGTNFDLAQGNLELLKKQFIVEDYTGK